MRTGFVVITVALLVVAAGAQQAKPAFEVASIRPQSEPLSLAQMATANPRVRPGGVFSASHATVRSLVLFAYNLKPFQLIGEPEWARRDTFAVEARAADEPPTEQVRLMVQSMLEERFALVVRRERRDVRFYALVVDRSDGRLGPFIQRVDGECTREAAAEVRKNFPPRVATTEDGMISGQCAGISGLADLISANLETPVIDQTGLSGKFVYSVLGVSLPRPFAPAGVLPDAPSQWPPIPVALREQLGLRLESRLGPFDVVVVDSVQQPTEN